MVEETCEQASRFYQAGALKQGKSSGNTVSPVLNVVEEPATNADAEEERSAAKGEESDHRKEEEIGDSVGV